MTIPHPILSPAAYHEHVNRAKTEKQFTAEVLALAKRCGFKAAHFRPAMNAKGQWRTAVQGDGKGFPDCVLANRRLKRTIFAELKSEVGRLTPEQKDWLDTLREAGQETYVWRPRDWSAIEGVLLSPRLPATRGKIL